MLKKILKIVCLLILISIVAAFGYLYQKQEALIFHPTKLDQSYQFDSEIPLKERNFTTSDGVILHGIHFKTPQSKGLVFYLHGNSGNVQNYLGTAYNFLNNGYDFFVYDYRGFGKSGGEIDDEKQLFADNQFVYNTLKKEYLEKNIVIAGYSIGSGMAAKLATTNSPAQLILLAPYNNFIDLVKMWNKYTPTFLLKYRFETDNYLESFSKKITVFHGKKDKVIPFQCAEALKATFPEKITLIGLDDVGHVGIDAHPKFQDQIRKILR